MSSGYEKTLIHKENTYSLSELINPMELKKKGKKNIIALSKTNGEAAMIYGHNVFLLSKRVSHALCKSTIQA